MWSRRNKLILAWLGIISLASFAAYREVESAVARLRIAFAEDQTYIFEEIRTKAAQANPAEAANCLGYVLNYYPSGTKQASGSPLDRIVERARRSAVREIIAILRAKTRRDFGDDPQRWVEGLRALEPR
jgi:hypothetical protein